MTQRRARVGSALAVLFLASGLGAGRLRAQATASIGGTVTDTSGAAVSESIVKTTNTGTGITRATITDSQGRFHIPDLATGAYDLEATKPGFQTVIRKGLVLTVGADPVIELAMPVGQTQQTVNVLGDVSQVETTSSSLTNLVDQTQMRELPLNGRNYAQLISLSPGVIALPNLQTNTLFGNQPDFSVSGMRATGSLFLLDGTDTTGYFQHGGGSGALGTSLGVDAIDQFQTLTNTYPAEYGGAGAVINSSTKSGTNQYHGSAYEFLRNSAIESRNFFDGSSAPPYRQNQFGGTFGGPIKKDKAFFFVNYEGFRADKTISNIATVPDAQAHNFLMPGAAGAYVPVAQNANPVTAQAIRDTLALYPVAQTEILTSAGLPTGTGFYTELNSTISYENYLVARFDYAISSKDAFFFRYVLDRASRQVDSLLHTHPELDLTRNNYATMEERRIISSTLVNLARFSFVRNAEYGAFPKIIPVLQFYPGEGRQDGTVSIGSNVSALNSGPAFYVIPNKITESDDMIWTHGAHNVKFGESTERRQENAWNPGGIMGAWTFANLTSFLQGVPLQVSGAPSDTQFPGLDGVKDWRERNFAFYFQDDWKLSRRLTLNLGVRYEPQVNPSFARHQPEVLLNAPYGNWVTVASARATNISLKNYDPRLGFAWDVFANHKTSVRGGVGIFHSLVFASETPMYQQPPYLRINQTAAQGAVYPIMFSNIPANGLSVPTNGTLSCAVCAYYGQSRTPTIYQYNLSIQRELTPSTIMSVAGVFSHSNFLMMQHDFNYAVPFTGADGNPTFGTLVNGNIVANPRLNPIWNALTLQNGQASSHYEGLQLGINRRLTRGLQTQFSYTYSKSMDDSSSGIGGFGDSGGTNPTNLRSDYGLSAFDRRENLRVSWVYQIPFKSGSAVLKSALGNWQLSGVYSYLSGSPFSPGVGFASTGTGAYTPRANVIAGCNFYPANQTLANWFNKSCFTPPAIGEFGNAGRNILTGPNLWNFDSSLSKEGHVRKISEQFTVQFRAEFFNIMNHPSFGNPSGALFNQGPNGTFLANANASLLTATLSQPRQIQVALKILF